MDLTHSLKHTSSSSNKVTYSRRMHGTERLLAAFAEHVDGCSHSFFGCSLTFKDRRMSRDQIMEYAKTAWIRTRFDAPWVAHRASTDTLLPNSWIQSYETALKREEADQVVRSWANETILWREEIHSLVEWERIIKNGYWKPSDDHFGAEWHFAKADDGGSYFVMGSGSHWVGDGRGFLPIVDLFLRYLDAEIRDCHGLVPTSYLSWGDEIPRLCSAAILAVEHKAKSPKPQIELPKYKEFARPLLETTGWRYLPDKQGDINLSRNETLTLHRICRNRNVTLTSFLNSLCILADIQTALHVASNTESTFRDLVQEFLTAEVYVMKRNLADRRYLLSKALPSVTGPAGFGNVIFQILPTYHSMNDIRKIIQINASESSLITANIDCDAFWSGLVLATDHSQKANKMSSAKEFVENELAIDSLIPAFEKSAFFAPGLGSTSIGKLSDFGLFNPFRPSVAGSDPISPFVLNKLAMGMRVAGPDCKHIMNVIWEYDGEITIHMLASPRWHSDKAWKLYGQFIREYLQQIFNGSSPKL